MVPSLDCPCLEQYPSWLNFDNVPQNYSTCDFFQQRLLPFKDNIPDLVCPFPQDFGLSCKKHDLIANGNCQGSSLADNPAYCYLEWCYVDKDRCFGSNHTIYEDKYIPDLYYSYSTCSGSISMDSLVEKKSKTLYGANITVVLPREYFPYFFMKDPSNSFPVFDYTEFQGAIIEYFDIIRKRYSIKSFSYAIRSGGSSKKQPTSSFTAAVSDVSDGLADMAGGNFWISAERLELAPFTVPFYSSPVYLYELKKTKKDIGFAIYGSLRPFTNYLWLVVAICLIAVGIVSVFVSTARSHDRWHKLLYFKRQKSSSVSRRARTLFQVSFDGFIQSTNQFFGKASEMEKESTLSHKVLVFGFGFFILIISASYTSNLATFLTVKNLGDYTSSMDDAMESNLKICAQPAIRSLMESQWDKLKDNNNVILVENSGFQFLTDASELLKNGTCDVMVADEIYFKFFTANEDETFCKTEIVSLKVPVMSLQWGFPIQPKYQAAFSETILEFPIQNDFDFSDILMRYTQPVSCDIYVESSSVDNAQLSEMEMAFPLFILSFSILLGIIIKISTYWCDDDFDHEKCAAFEEPQHNKDSSNDNHTTGQNTDNISVDMLEYKNRIDLISLNIQKLQHNYVHYFQNLQDRTSRNHND